MTVTVPEPMPYIICGVFVLQVAALVYSLVESWLEGRWYERTYRDHQRRINKILGW